ncbi:MULTISPECIES: SRPBCC family protein [unclassified Nocardioides]|uniref:SRPBCC family protein n=1 Tax=unclassified Nocardioides TaxID=2615069 RepID=UPI000701B163|nr:MULTISPECIES: SRPBCC family protein [unclassified Nocardioides]KQY63951.1 hypothetical protein ASD30_02935 [Nocardioides sp. Root140]KQZ69869.1 hypothetical protein ASD66_09180 [Nocardioides sp. Root151]KRF15965.1 hypothetical protein ASH02_04940 [Nocardioides sp. Soil796]
MTGHVIHLNTEVEADPDTVWQVLTDLVHADHILRSVDSVELTSDGPYAAGTTWREKRTMFGHHGVEELEVTVAEAPHRTIHETRLGHDRIRTAYSLQSHTGERTKLLLTANIDIGERNRAESLMWNIWGGFSFDATRRMLTHDLEDIKAEAEQRIGGRSRLGSAS